MNFKERMEAEKKENWQNRKIKEALKGQLAPSEQEVKGRLKNEKIQIEKGRYRLGDSERH